MPATAIRSGIPLGVLRHVVSTPGMTVEALHDAVSSFDGRPDDADISLGDLASAGAPVELIGMSVAFMPWHRTEARREVVGAWLLPAIRRVSSLAAHEAVADAIMEISRWVHGDADADLKQAERSLALMLEQAEIPMPKDRLAEAARHVAYTVLGTLRAVLDLDPFSAAKKLSLASIGVVSAGAAAENAGLVAQIAAMKAQDADVQALMAAGELDAAEARLAEPIPKDGVWACFTDDEQQRQLADIVNGIPPTHVRRTLH